MVVTSVAEAEVQIDGVAKGGPGQPISLPPGQHSITVMAKGHKAVTKVVEIEASRDPEVCARKQARLIWLSNAMLEATF